MNDSLRTDVFVRFQAETIACACIYLAARALQVRRNSANLKLFFLLIVPHWHIKMSLSNKSNLDK